MRKKFLRVVVLPKNHAWFHRLFRTKQWKAAKLAEKFINAGQQQIQQRVEREILNAVLYGRGEMLTFH